jgi:hypothetical protein
MTVTPDMTMTLSLELLFAAAAFLIGCAWAARAAYSKIMSALVELREDIEAVKERNRMADAEAERIRVEQASQKTNIAVMAEQITGIGRTLERVDRGMTELLRARSGNRPGGAE